MGVGATVVASRDTDEARASLFTRVVAALLHARAVEGVDNRLLQHEVLGLLLVVSMRIECSIGVWLPGVTDGLLALLARVDWLRLLRDI